MKTVNAQAIKDYQVCELFYKYRYEDKLKESVTARDLLADRFENSMKRVVAFFFYKKQGGLIPSYNALLNRWEKLWFPKEMTAYDLSIERHSSRDGSMVSYNTLATAALLDFYEQFSSDTSEILILDEKFLIPIGKNIRLEGEFDVVLRTSKGAKVIRWGTRQVTGHRSNKSFDFAALKLAFDYRNKIPQNTTYGLYDLSTTNPGWKEYIPTERDTSSLLYWIRRIDETEDFVPRRGYTVYCKGCVFDNSCKNWQFLQ